MDQTRYAQVRAATRAGVNRAKSEAPRELRGVLEADARLAATEAVSRMRAFRRRSSLDDVQKRAYVAARAVYQGVLRGRILGRAVRAAVEEIAEGKTEQERQEMTNTATAAVNAGTYTAKATPHDVFETAFQLAVDALPRGRR